MNRYHAVKVEGKKMDTHRWVWEQANGPIPPGHLIHHIDGDPRNNDIQNLACITKSEHAKIHGWMPPQKPPAHGKAATYERHGCRCEDCRMAHNASVRAWKERRKARLQSVGVD